VRLYYYYPWNKQIHNVAILPCNGAFEPVGARNDPNPYVLEKEDLKQKTVNRLCVLIDDGGHDGKTRPGEANFAFESGKMTSFCIFEILIF
jgi:hypothetical protein